VKNGGSDPKIIHRAGEYHSPSPVISWLFGKPLPTADAAHQAVGKLVGLAVFASDALSSTAYATQEILIILAVAGLGAFGYIIPISIAIVVLLAIVTISYEQTIHAYPSGGGAYIVARDNLGTLSAQIAGAALLTDYILTVAVSVSAGVAQVISAFPNISPYRVGLGVGAVILIMVINLRGVRESGAILSIPTYFFLGMIFLTVIVGFYKLTSGSLGSVENPPQLDLVVFHPITWFLLLRAFSGGTAALTGVEAISNGVPAFKEPKSRNAGITLIWMAVILGIIFLSISFLSVQVGAIPSETETVISQLVRTVFSGSNALYLAVISATTLILFMAANTSFADFPRLSALLAIDRFLPRQFTFRGSRLVFSWGIVFLAFVASALIVIFKASVTGLIPLYAIGVFLSFTLSQTGMGIRWYKCGRLKPDEELIEKGSILHFDTKWRIKMLVNLFGACATAVVTLIFAITKFTEGAWLILILTPSLVALFYAIHRHYIELAGKLSLNHIEAKPRLSKQRVIIMISGVHQGTLAALNFARSLSKEITAVHIATDLEQTEKITQKWERWVHDIPLVIIDSPYRQLLHPLVTYIENAALESKPGEAITVVVPEFIPQRWWHNFLHMQTATWLRQALKHIDGVIVIDVPYQLD